MKFHVDFLCGRVINKYYLVRGSTDKNVKLFVFECKYISVDFQVDRCVSGLVAQQQCVGPLHTPLADCAVVALSYTELVGAATSIGTQNVKGLLSPAAGARLSLGEALTNLVSALHKLQSRNHQSRILIWIYNIYLNILMWWSHRRFHNTSFYVT